MFDIEYWHWMVAGAVLVLAELVIPSFTVLWFGVAAVLVGVLMWLGLDPGIVWQIFIWAVCSIILLLLWLRWLRPVALSDRSDAELGDAFLQERGILSRVPKGEEGWAQVNFSVPINGSEVWKCKLRGSAKEGDFVTVIEIQNDVLWVAADQDPDQITQ